MTINSDKHNVKNPTLFQKIYNIFFTDFHQTLIIGVTPIITYFIYMIIPDDIVILILSSILGTIVFCALNDDGCFSNPKAMAVIIYNALIIVMSFLLWATDSTAKERDTLDLKPYITTIQANKANDMFQINMKLPFEKNVEVRFPDKKFNALFASKDHFKEFSIYAVKTCNKYRFKSVECSTEMIIKHQSVGKNIYECDLKKSVYPKKLQFEIEQEKKDSK